MEEGREVVLKTDLEIKDEAKRKVTIVEIILNGVITIIMIHLILTSEIRQDLFIVTIVIFLILWSVIIIGITWLGKYVMPLVFEQAEYAKRRIAYVNVSLSAETFVKVKKNKQDDFMRKLQDMAEFYAIINEKNNLVEIWIKFDSEEEKCKYEDVTKKYFYDFYSIQE